MIPQCVVMYPGEVSDTDEVIPLTIGNMFYDWSVTSEAVVQAIEKVACDTTVYCVRFCGDWQETLW